MTKTIRRIRWNRMKDKEVEMMGKAWKEVVKPVARNSLLALLHNTACSEVK
jgi:hypothetical protein